MASPAHQDHACSSTRPRRRRRVVVADGTARDESLWASLPEDLISLVAWRVLAGDLRDYVRLRAVCRRWRSGTPSPRGRGVLRGYVRFFNLSTGAFVRVRLPIFRDHCVLDSIDGILLLQRDHDTAVRLLHPFTGDILDFPPLETLLAHVNPWFPGENNSTYIRKVLAASISVGADGLVKVMMSLHHIQNVCFATSGDQQWRVSSWLQDVCSVPLGFQGKLYMLRRPESNGAQPEVVQVDPPQQEDVDFGSPLLPPPKFVAKCPQVSS
nr:unnamed protein product [Digitaria exilis]CAB3483505.1 unnamed protein product [Digitaria exilis]